jgi:hypothetical protein
MLNKSIIMAAILSATAGLTSAAFAQTETHRPVVHERQLFLAAPADAGLFNSSEPRTYYVPGFGNIGAGAGPGGF